MRISDWSSDVCSSDLSTPSCAPRSTAASPATPATSPARPRSATPAAALNCVPEWQRRSATRKRVARRGPASSARRRIKTTVRTARALHLRAFRAQNGAMITRLSRLLLLPLLAASAGGALAQEGDITIYRCTDASGHRSEEHTSELQSLMRISYAVFCLKK